MQTLSSYKSSFYKNDMRYRESVCLSVPPRHICGLCQNSWTNTRLIQKTLDVLSL